jgi:hypothetical protein
MKSLRDYITEAENIQPGDEFDIELAPDRLIESYVVETADDYIVIEANDEIMAVLEQGGYLEERIGRYGAVGSSRAMGFTMGENLDEHGGGIGPEQHWQDLMKEGAFKQALHSDAERMRLEQFVEKYREYEGAEEFWKDVNEPMSDQQPVDQSHWDFGRILELAGVSADHADPLAAKAAALAPVGADSGSSGVTTIDEDPTQQETGYAEFGSDNDETSAEDPIGEAEYQGRNVPLGKPMRGDVKKFKVYVKDPKTGNVKKVNFGHGGTSAKRAGQKTMKIKKSNPARRKSFRARHNCANPGPRTKARYWSCRAW